MPSHSERSPPLSDVRTTAACLAVLPIAAITAVQSGAASAGPPGSASTTVGGGELREGVEGAVCVDEGHRNLHRAGGTYAVLAARLEEAGFRVRASSFAFRRDSLRRCDVLVVANALHERNYVRGGGEWALPTPSAFTGSEIEAVRVWVEGGGALLLIADHMPFPGNARDLAAAFGVRFSNGFAVDTAARGQEFGSRPGSGQLVFRRSDGSLRGHPITHGDAPHARVDSVMTYTGQAFVAPGDFRPLLVVPETTISLLPRVAWEFGEGTPAVDAGGWLQGAAATFGSGRLVVLGEAAVFRPGEDGALRGHNGRFGVNIVRWLSGARGEGSDGT